ncbi:MAG: hypothetical protein ACREP6_00175, partial [Candidatus Binataceae bacterium]
MLSSPINAQHGAYLLIALAASAMMTAGLLIMKRRADALPVASGARIAHAVGCWISDPVWDAGLAAQSAGFVLYLVALTSLPVSVTAVVMQGGVGLFVLCAVLMLGERARMREWLGIAVTVGAMLLLSASLGGGNSRDVIDVQLTVLV